MKSQPFSIRLALLAIVGLCVTAGAVWAEDPTAPEPLRVLTYNIHHGEGMDGKVDLARIAQIIRRAKPDLVALQEVDRNTARTGNVDQARELARLTGLNVAFGGNIALQGGEYGNAVLSRQPIARFVNHPLPSLGVGEQRGVLEVEIQLEGKGSLVLLVTHLDHRPAESERLASAEMINRLAKQSGAARLLLAGDLNAVPTSGTLGILKSVWAEPRVGPQDEPLLTIPVVKPRRQIDHVLLRPKNAWKVIAAQVLDEPVASDHLPLLVTLEMPDSVDSAQ